MDIIEDKNNRRLSVIAFSWMLSRYNLNSRLTLILTAKRASSRDAYT